MTSPADPLTVLVVEDDPALLRVLPELLRAGGYRSLIASTGRDAISVGTNATPRPAIAIVDLKLPDIDGMEVIARLKRAIEPIETVVVTGDASVDTAVRALHQQSDDYLVKPFAAERLFESLERAAERWYRRRAELALRDNEERMRFALAAACMGIWEWQIATDQLTWSDSMKDVYGIPVEAFPKTRQAFLTIVHPDDRHFVSELKARVQDPARDAEDFQNEYRITWPDGTVHWVLSKGQVQVDHTGRPYRVLGVAMEQSERKQLEAQFRQAQKMEAVGQLAGGVAHDFNNLLTSILGFSRFALEEDAGTNPRLRRDIEEVLKAGESAAALTQQLLAFSRKQVLQLRSVDLNEVVRDAEKLLRRVIGADIEIVTRRTPDLPRITADPSQVSQILLNLAVNARDAMPVSGILTIETAVAYLDESYSQAHQALVTPGRYVMVAVTDNGSGMDADTQAHLFEPFFTTKAPGRGAGLGLATVYGIVKQSGGFIWVYSEIGRGTTFKVYFPAEGHLDAPKVPAEPDSAVAHGTETVLLVEDATSVRELARQALERHGYRVIAAADGRQALDLAEAERGRIDLLLTDLVMPGMGGREVADRLKALMPEIRVLYTSGYTDDTVVRHRLLTDGLAYLQKPFLPSQLARKVRAVLDGALGEP